MSSDTGRDSDDPFVVLKAMYSIGVVIVVLAFLGRNGCPGHNQPAAPAPVNVTPAPPTGPSTAPYTPSNSDEKRVAEAVRRGGGSVDISGALLFVRMPGALPTADVLSRLGALKHRIVLDLRESRVSDEDLTAIVCLDQLSSLNLSGTVVTDEGLRYVSGLRDLRGLDLNNTGVTDSGVRQIASLRALRSLALNETMVTDTGLAELAGMPELLSLYLNGTAVTDAGLEYLPSLPKLGHVAVTGTPVSRVADRRLAGNTFRLAEDGIVGFYRVSRAAEIAALDAERELASRPVPPSWETGSWHQPTPSRTIGRRRR
ncbi:hypothetical protein J0H58_31835 [bacterium]|nr:hypothetical protein [bacterium]